MIISSKINDSKLIWVKIPKTGTRAYSKILVSRNGENIESKDYSLHFHVTFEQLYTHHNKNYSGFTIVRHPVTRFISALNHLADINSECSTLDCINHPGKLPLDNIDRLVEFIYDNFHTNCVPRNNLSFKQIFGVDYTAYYDAFFKTQVYWAYHPKMTWFYYENLNKFNMWLQQTFGIDTSKIQKIGNIKKKHLEHLDMNDGKFIKMIEYLFYDDYKVYNYPLQYSV